MIHDTTKKYSASVFILYDFALLNAAFILVHFIKNQTWVINDAYLQLLGIFYLAWGLVSFIARKFDLARYPNMKAGYIQLIRNNIFLLYLLALALVVTKTYHFSRIQTFGTTVLLFALEAISFSLAYSFSDLKARGNTDSDSEIQYSFKHISLTTVFVDWILMTASFFLMNYLKRGTFELTENYQDMLFVVYAIWLIASASTQKFANRDYRNYYYALAPYIKSMLFMVATMAVIVFAFRMFYLSRLQMIGGFGLLLVLESVYVFYRFLTRNQQKAQEDIHTVDEVYQSFRQEELPFELEKINSARNKEIISVRSKLRNKYLKHLPDLYDCVEKHITLDTIDEEDAVVLDTHTMFNIENVENHSASMFVNLHKVNDFRFINRYFLEVHKKIFNGGYFIGKVDTIATYRRRFFKKFPWIIGSVLYPFHFIFKRMMPKLPGIRKVYFFITRGKNRVLSKAETFGRLYFCGFKVIGEKEIDDSLYFIAQRVKNPSIDRSPSYGPTIQLKRVGLDGKIFFIRKFRTMHPYSEYLQDYVYQRNSLSEGGKFKNDFRLTEWGRWMRKMWIDEIPQLLNFWRGDISMVGVRALSEHYFSLYPKEMQQFRTQFKPGLVPPYYADMPKTFEEIVESERNYLINKKQHPFTTDLKYFFKAWYNILFKKARSA